MSWVRPFSFALVAVSVGCGTTWKVDDIDGDGVTPAEGDCWDSLDPVPGFGVTGDKIYPGARDTWYDGLDQNCDGMDDFDADGDGYVPADHIGKETYGVEGTGVNHPPEADCWDAEIDSEPPSEFTVVSDADYPWPQPTPDVVNPGAAAGQVVYEDDWSTDEDGWVDFWYDGVDTNCDGTDDFDQDGDTVRSLYHPDQDGAVGEDCIDGSDRDDVNPAGTDPADVNPAATEIWWDGTDQDCDYDTTVDCDQDADGFRGDPTVEIEELDDSACEFGDEESIDCNDEISSVFPTEDPEIYYNGTDDNCDYSDRDGDKDGDGSWAMDYADRLGGNTVDESTVTPPDSPGDCWDDPDWDDLTAGTSTGFSLTVKDGFTSLTAAEVFRDAADRPYDGADQDCRPADYDGNGAEDDFDWDGDSYTVEAFEDLSYQFGDDCLDCPNDCFDGTWTGTDQQGWCDTYCYVDTDGDGFDDNGTPVQDENPGGVDTTDINGGVDPEYDIAYDGTDQNCDDWSDWDYDRDGEDHMNAASYGGPSGGTDCHEGSDITTGLSIDDTFAYPNPAGLQPAEINSAASETWYDGTDQDCDAWPSDDDADKDGEDHEEQGGTDCYEDTWKDVDTNPGGVAPANVNTAATETWYDGTDQDCDDWSDDDADRDGQDHEVQGGSDCYEGTSIDVDGNPAGLAASSIRTGATDTWYDGTDADCDDNDGDADGDGHYIDTYAFTQHASSPYPVDDCDDADSGINPDETEIAGDEVDTDCDTTELCYDDQDDDGYRLTSTLVSSDIDCTDSGEAVSSDPTGDCDDTDALEYPSAAEICDGQDNDCDGSLPSDEVDDDGDGYVECTIHSGGWDSDSDPISGGEDCVDTDADEYPSATEICDGRDNDCDGSIPSDEVDDDSDGYVECTLHTDGWDSDAAAGSKLGDDCDDTDSGDYPGAPETVGNNDDEDCDGVDECYVDADDDGYRTIDTSLTVASADADCTDSGEAVSTDPDSDCDDSDSGDYPGATEIVGNNDDEDCDGAEICYVDVDDDGYRPDASSTVASADTDCTDSGEAVSTDPTTDCDDSDAGDYPGATETIGNGDDEDCDGGEICYVDVDDDGYRPDASSTVVSSDDDCSDSGEALSSEPTTDCDDSDANDYPGATETTGNGDDEDCDGGEICYVDADNDGYRPDASSTVTSADPDCNDDGEALSSEPTTDCDDSDANDYPGATETVGNNDDEDCDGAEICYVDADDDGYRPDATSTVASADTDCTDAGEAVRTDPTTDCDDSDSGDYPGATETIGNGDDEDCDGAETCYVDADDDGYRPDASSTVASADTDCTDSGEALSSEPTTDCDDADANDYPGATETIGNGDDEDCDGGEVCYYDQDSDGYLPSSATTVTSSDEDCDDATEALATALALDDDCDPATSSVYPGATEVVGDEVDQDCDGGEICYLDDDEDGDVDENGTTITSVDDDCDDTDEADNTAPQTDCDDDDAAVSAASGTEGATADGKDNDCDDYYDEGGLLADGDLVITEIHFKTASPLASTNGEWLEMYNPTSTDIVLGDGWTVTDLAGSTASGTVELTPATIPAGGHAVLARSTTGTDTTYVATYSSVALNNGGDGIVLAFEDPDTGTITMDTVDFSDASFTLPSGNGITIQLDNVGTSSAPIYPTDNADGANWCESETTPAATYEYTSNNFGTPATVNDACPP